MMRLLLRDMARPTRNWQGMVRPTPSRQPSPALTWTAGLQHTSEARSHPKAPVYEADDDADLERKRPDVVYVPEKFPAQTGVNAILAMRTSEAAAGVKRAD